jgi:hypothetical protein
MGDSRGCAIIVGSIAMTMACGPLVIIPLSTKQDDSWYEGVEHLIIGCVFFSTKLDVHVFQHLIFSCNFGFGPIKITST